MSHPGLGNTLDLRLQKPATCGLLSFGVLSLVTLPVLLGLIRTPRFRWAREKGSGYLLHRERYDT